MTPSTDNGNRRSSIVTEISVEQGHGEEQRPEDHQGPAIIQERGIGPLTVNYLHPVHARARDHV
jgi:hypothetical protein